MIVVMQGADADARRFRYLFDRPHHLTPNRYAMLLQDDVALGSRGRASVNHFSQLETAKETAGAFPRGWSIEKRMRLSKLAFNPLVRSIEGGADRVVGSLARHLGDVETQERTRRL